MNTVTESARRARAALKAATDGSGLCGAIRVGHDTVYFEHSTDVAALAQALEDNDDIVDNCDREAHYECLDDKCCDEHLLELIKDKLPYFADDCVVVRVF